MKPSALLDVFKRWPIEFTRGEGVFLEDRAGRRYLDFYGGHAVCSLGHCHPRLVEVIERQARTLFFQSNLVELEVRERAARKLVDAAPSSLTRAFFVNSGAEANENALRVAFLTTGRPRVVAVEGAFHGRTAGTAAITANHARWYGFPNAPYPVTTVPFDDVEALERAIDASVAAVVLEPVQGVAGARALSPAFLRAARALTRRQGALLVFDEVQIGLGRSGAFFAAQHYGVEPDALTVAKGIAGGFPASALIVSDALAQKLGPGDLGTTFGGGPLACALVEAVIDVIESEALLPRVRRLSARLFESCITGPVESVQGLGFLIGLRTRRPAAEVLAELREQGVLAGGSADPHVIRLMPPLILEDEHVDRLVEVLSRLPA